MNTDPTTPALPGWQRNRLAVLLDAIGDRPITDWQRRSSAAPSGFIATVCSGSPGHPGGLGSSVVVHPFTEV